MEERNAYSAFSSVDDVVAKPVFGSDGAASWQEFKKKDAAGSSFFNQHKRPWKELVAPGIPMKKSDRLGTGFSTLSEERANERKVREENGDAALGSGYTSFQRRQNDDDDNDITEAMAKKRAKMITDRIRPDEVTYYIQTDTFDGWKEDYIFTTRHRGIGYYWDGMDSLKKQLGLVSVTPCKNDTKNDNNNNKSEEISKKKKTIIGQDDDKTNKKKKKKKQNKKYQKSQDLSDLISPMDQVANAIRRRNEAVMGTTSLLTSSTMSNVQAVEMAALTGNTVALSSIYTSKSNNASKLTAPQQSQQSQQPQLSDHGWEEANDPATDKTYYFQRSTNKRQWENPLLEKKKLQHESTIITLPDGWKSVKDTATGKTYYYHEKRGDTSWERPSV